MSSASKANTHRSLMTNRQRALAVLRYEPYDRLPLVHFGFWQPETLAKWATEGHVTEEEVRTWRDGGPVDASIGRRLGFDFNWFSTLWPEIKIYPRFEYEVLKTLPDGMRHVRNPEGVVIVESPGATSIPAEIEHLLTDRRSWETHFKWRYQFTEERVAAAQVCVEDRSVRFDEGGLEFLRAGDRDYPYGLHCGSLFGQIRSVLGLTGLSYLMVDDEPLLDEIIDTVAEMSYQVVRYVLESGAKLDYGHFWEDICFKNGPLVSPDFFRRKVGPHYRRITSLLGQHGIDVVSVDCDGLIDSLLPIWLDNGVNTMFPIEVGTWGASIEPWRRKYGRALRGVGGVRKAIFAEDRAAVDAEIERLRPLVELGGYLPCPDHRIPPNADWDLVRYYCDCMRAVFG